VSTERGHDRAQLCWSGRPTRYERRGRKNSGRKSDEKTESMTNEKAEKASMVRENKMRKEASKKYQN
jgi:hypothetical protein